MDKITVKKITFGDMDAVYLISEEGQVAFAIVPSMDGGVTYDNGGINPLIQLSITGDSSSLGFAAGETRFNSGLTMSMRYVSQTTEEDCDSKTVITYLENSDGIKAEHIVFGRKDYRCLKIHTRVINESKDAIMLEALSSFCLTGITPYANDTAIGRLSMHRFLSRWSAEGRHEERSIEDLMLEPSWANFGVRCEKFGALGSMPVRGYFPVALIEDKGAGVVWGVTNECDSSWQIEAVRIDDKLSITGGLADFEYGHFRKSLAVGEALESPISYITVAKSDWEEACDRLLDGQRMELTGRTKREALPAVFNEYCATWGKPGEEIISKMLSVINGDSFEYFVIDAGWYADSVKGWQDNMGDWNVSKDLFPNGLKRVVDMINSAGMKAGIWFELEVVGKDSDMVNDEEHLLTRDGKVIISGTRRFWDLRKEWVENYLTNKVIDFLNTYGFEYIKIDYNDTIGIGCDGAESYGEGLRQCLIATKSFFKKIRENVPNIAIEVCSSGGHRLEPGFMNLADYLSFSDAHETPSIPVIAADLHRLILPSKSQIWAVLRKDDDLKRITYSVCAGMYGVLCISGDVVELDDNKFRHAIDGVEFYKKVSGIIANGVTERFGMFQNSQMSLKDYQASVRYGKNNDALVIVHSFAVEGPQNISIPLDGKYYIEDKYECMEHKIVIEGNMLKILINHEYDAIAMHLKSKNA